MAATLTDIRRWLNTGKEKGATHVIVLCDQYDFDDFPIYVMPGEVPREVLAKKKEAGPMIQPMECYNLSMDLETQMGERRANHWD